MSSIDQRRTGLRRRLLLAALLWSLYSSAALLAVESAPTARVIVVVGAEGSAEFAPQFQKWASAWSAAAERSQIPCRVIGLETDGETPDRDLLAQELQKSVSSKVPLWIVLLGHGTFDGKTARFNLRGLDLTPADLKGWLIERTSPVAIINCASCSGPFLTELSGPQRVIITATRSGHEYNFARFGEHLSTAITNPEADLDKDEQTSLLEAYLYACGQLQEYYTRESRLATEHPLLDDNGDRQGTPPDWYAGVRVIKQSKSGAVPDGTAAAQFVLIPSPRDRRLSAALRERRANLEELVASLRRHKAQLPEEEYFQRLEPLLIELSQIGEQAEAGTESNPQPAQVPPR